MQFRIPKLILWKLCHCILILSITRLTEFRCESLFWLVIHTLSNIGPKILVFFKNIHLSIFYERWQFYDSGHFHQNYFFLFFFYSIQSPVDYADFNCGTNSVDFKIHLNKSSEMKTKIHDSNLECILVEGWVWFNKKTTFAM